MKLNFFIVRTKFRHPHRPPPLVLIFIIMLMILAISRVPVASNTVFVDGQVMHEIRGSQAENSFSVNYNNRGNVGSQQEGTRSEYKDPVTGQLLSQIMVESGTVRSDRGSSIMLPEFNNSVSVSFNFLVGRNLSIQAAQIFPTGDSVVDPILVQNDESALSGYFIELTRGQWILTIATSSPENVSFLVLIKIQHVAWSLQTSIELKPDIKVSEAFLIPNDRHFWRVSLEKNQRGRIHVTADSLSLLGARLQVYAESNIFQPLFEIREDESIQSNAFNVSWVAEAKQSYIIVIIAGNELNSEINPYSIVFHRQESGYSFSTAIPLELNTPQVILQESSQTIISQHYFTFSVSSRQPTETVEIIVTEITEDILENARMYVFDSPNSGTPLLVLEEQNSPRDGIMRTTIDVQVDARYYIVIEPTVSLSGSYRIEVHSAQAITFLFEFVIFLISLVITVGITIRNSRLFFLQLKPFSYVVPIKKDDFINHVRSILRLNYLLSSYNETDSNAQVLLPFSRFPIFKVQIWYLEPASSEDTETKIELQPSWTSYIHIIELGLFFAVLIANQAFYYYMLGWNWTFFFLSDVVSPLVVLMSLLIVGLLTFVLILVPRMFFLLWRRNLDEIMILMETMRTLGGLQVKHHLSSKDALNRIAYVRVLWSQAKKAYKSGEKSLFVIKADSCVKHLVYLRARQLGMTDFKKKDFMEIVEFLRENGFDVPSRTKIKKNHEFRNRITHSTYMPTDDEIQKSLEYYQTFISRLGLRT